MAKKQTKKATNPVQVKLDALVQERESIVANMEKARADYNQGQVRLIEINSAINTIVELFSEGANNDSESEADTKSGTNEA